MAVPRYFKNTVALNNATAVDIKDPGTGHTAYVTKCTLSIVTHANGKLFQLQDSSGSPVVFAKHIDTTAAAGVPSTVTWDFGGKKTQGGIPMTLSKKVQVVSEASGIAGYAYVEGFVI